MSYFNFSKKVFAAFSALALLVTGCNSKSSIATDDPEPEVKHFTITVDNITAGTCVLNILRDDPDQGYYYAVVKNSYFQTLGNDFQTRAKAYLQGQVDFYISEMGTSEEQAIAYTIVTEDVVDDEIDYLYGATDYIVIAGYVDEKAQVAGDFEYLEFSTVTPDPSNNTFQISIDNVSARSVSYSVTPSIDDEPYALVVERVADYAGLSDEEIAHSLIHDKYSYFIDYAEGEASRTAEISAGTEYAVYVFGLDSSHSVATTALYKEVFTSGKAGDPSKMTISVEFASGAVNGYKLDYTVTPSDESIDYFVQLIDDSWTVEAFTKSYKERILEGLKNIEGMDLSTYLGFMSTHGVYHSDETVCPGQKYKVAVLPVDVANAELPYDAIFSETYTAVAPSEGTATLEVAWDKYYDGDAIVELNSAYSHLAGKCVFPVTVKNNTGATFYYNVFKDDGETYSKEGIIYKLVSKGYSWEADLEMPFDTDGVIYAVAVDADGNPGPIAQYKVKFLKEGASDAQEYLDSQSYYYANKSARKPVAGIIDGPVHF